MIMIRAFAICIVCASSRHCIVRRRLARCHWIWMRPLCPLAARSSRVAVGNGRAEWRKAAIGETKQTPRTQTRPPRNPPTVGGWKRQQAGQQRRRNRLPPAPLGRPLQLQLAASQAHARSCYHDTLSQRPDCLGGRNCARINQAAFGASPPSFACSPSEGGAGGGRSRGLAGAIRPNERK